MRPMLVVEGLELTEGMEQVTLVPDQSPVEQFTAAGLHPPLHHRVHTRHPRPGQHHSDTGIGHDHVEQLRELAVPVTDQEPCPAAGILQIHDQIPRRLAHPRCGRVAGGAQNTDAAGVVLDDRQHVHAGARESHGLQEVTRQQRLGLRAQEPGPGCGGTLRRRIDAGVLEDLPDSRRRHLDTEHLQLAVHPPIAPARVLPHQAQNQQPDGADGRWTARPLGSGASGVPTGNQVTVPTQHRVRPHQQPRPAQCTARQPVQQRRQQCPVRSGEPHPRPGQLALQHGDLMPQHQNLGVLLPIGHREQAEGSEGVRHGQVGQSQQHSHPSSRGNRLAAACPCD